MSVNLKRVQKLNTAEYKGGTVIYQMCRDVRATDNDALLFAQELAKKYGGQLIVNYVIWNYEWKGSTRRFYDWVVPSLQEVESELLKHNIPLVITFENERFFTKKDFEQIPAEVGAIVIDELPLHFMKKWKEQFLKYNAGTPLYEVDAHNCIPVWELSPKQEFAAHTIRRKVHAKLPDFLEDYTKLSTHHENNKLLETLLPIDWDGIALKIRCNESISSTGDYIPGEKNAKKMLTHFLNTKLDTYDSTRNEINSNGQSNLSPYISHGNISRRRIILELLKKSNVAIENAFDEEKNGSSGTMGSIAAFIEECVIRAELCENFCFYNSNYDSYEGFPNWAKETLQKASIDTREYIYSFSQFEKGDTHDDLWNAAQMQMLTTGKMHGYMRMYWAKKILEWSATPQDAMKIAIKLNDMYELDGRDPGGYVGCAWSVGGLHDRPWFGRPVFGAIRYMAESGVKKRGNINEYIEKWITVKNKLFS